MNWQEVINDPTLHDLPYKIELNEHGKIVMSPASNRHGRLQGEIYSILREKSGKGKCYIECSVETSKGVKVADVAWASNDFFKTFGDETPFIKAPEICVEVLSPSNSKNEIDEKIDLYLAKGAQEVWIATENGEIKFYNHSGEIIKSQLIKNFPDRLDLS
jgi:Uma2 family endonuclease